MESMKSSKVTYDCIFTSNLKIRGFGKSCDTRCHIRIVQNSLEERKGEKCNFDEFKNIRKSFGTYSQGDRTIFKFKIVSIWIHEPQETLSLIRPMAFRIILKFIILKFLRLTVENENKNNYLLINDLE